MPVGAVEQRSGRANFNAVAALRAVQPAAKGADDGIRAPIAGFDRLFAHPLITDARATLAENATLRIVSHHGREIFLRLSVLAFYEALFEIAPVESQFLQLAFA